MAKEAVLTSLVAFLTTDIHVLEQGLELNKIWQLISYEHMCIALVVCVLRKNYIQNDNRQHSLVKTDDNRSFQFEVEKFQRLTEFTNLYPSPVNIYMLIASLNSNITIYTCVCIYLLIWRIKTLTCYLKSYFHSIRTEFKIS